MFTIRAPWRGFAWTRRLYVGMGKTSRLRPRTCMCRPFQNTEIVRHFIAELCNPGRAVLHVGEWRNRAILRNSREWMESSPARRPAINSCLGRYRFYAIDFWFDKTGRNEKISGWARRKRNFCTSSLILSFMQIFITISIQIIINN